MTECNKKFLVIYKNYPTRFDSVDWLSISFDSVISLTGFAMDFKLGSATRHFTNLSQASVVNLTKTETDSLEIGLANASIIVTDTENNSKPFTTSIPVMVKNWVEGDVKLDTFNMSVDVTLDNTTQFTIKIETAKVGQEEAQRLISEHNTSEQAHQFIQQNITVEATARASADNTLQANITAEASSRQAADTTLTNNLNTEIATRENADGVLETAITAEATTRGNADTILQGNIDVVSGSLSSHIGNTNNPHSVSKSQVGLGNVSNIDTTNASNITSGTLNNARLDTIPYSKLSGVASSEQGALADSALQPNDNITELTNNAGYQNATQVNTAITGSIINDVQHTSTDKSLSANMGKELQDQINNLKQRGRYLSIWNCATGKATTIPTVNPYAYKSGDYFIVGIVASGSGTNYRPNGATYDKDVASTTVETGDVIPNDTYYYDGTNWTLLHTEQPTVAFSTLAGSPYDNSNLAAALNSKQNTIDSTHKLSADLVDDSTTTNKFVTAQDKTNWNNKVDKNNPITAGTHTKITYDTKGLVTGGANLETRDIPDLSSTYYLASNPSGYITSSAITGKEDTSNKVTSISSSSTDTQYPSAKAVYDNTTRVTFYWGE